MSPHIVLICGSRTTVKHYASNVLFEMIKDAKRELLFNGLGPYFPPCSFDRGVGFMMRTKNGVVVYDLIHHDESVAQMCLTALDYLHPEIKDAKLWILSTDLDYPATVSTESGSTYLVHHLCKEGLKDAESKAYTTLRLMELFAQLG